MLLEAVSQMHYRPHLASQLESAGCNHFTLRTIDTVSELEAVLATETPGLLFVPLTAVSTLPPSLLFQISTVILCHDEETDQALAVSKNGFCDVVPLSQLNRLPFIIHRELEHRKNRDRFRSIVEDQTDLICRYDADGRLTFVNRAYQMTYGQGDKSLIGKCIFDMIPEEQQTVAQANVNHLTLRTPVAVSQHLSIMPDGTQRWFEWTDRALFDAAGQLVEFQGVGRDITDRVRLEAEQAAYAKSREAMHHFLSSTLDAFPANTAVLDQDGTIVMVNASWRHFANENGCPDPSAYLGTNYLALCETISTPSGVPLAAQLRGVINGQQDFFSIEYPCDSPTEVRWFSMQVTPFSENPPRRVVVAHANITAQKLAEQELQALHNATSYLFKAGSLSNLAHQIVQAVVQEFAYVDCTLLLVMPPKQEIQRYAHAGIYDTHSGDSLGTSDSELIALAFRTGKIVSAKDVAQVSLQPRTRSELVVPLVTMHGVIGVLDLHSPELKAFSARDQRVLTAYAERAAAAIEIMQLYDAVSQHAGELKQHVAKRTAELQASKERVEAILNHSFDAILLTHNDLHIRQVNPAFSEMIGYTQHECINRSLLDFIQRDDHTNITTLDELINTGQFEKPVEVRVVRKNGDAFDAELSIGFIKENGLVCTIRDITHRKQVERELRYQASLQEQVSDAVIVIDLDSKIRSWNRAAEHIYGWTADEAIGKDFIQFLHTQLDDPNLVETAKAELCGEGHFAHEVVQHHRSGSMLDVLVSASLLRDEHGHLRGVIFIIHDISERKRTEQVLRDALAKERELSELKTRFVSMASHEFRTPLATILALTETLMAYRHQFPDHQIDRRLQMIQEQIGYLRGIMDDVLLLARMQARRVDFNPAYLDLDGLCQSVIDEFQNRPNVTYQLVYHKKTDLPPIFLDGKLIRQILVNLVSNAIKYSPENSIVVIQLESSSDKLLLKVHDDGIGIPEPDAKHLFEPFHRGANVGTISGTGLGLVITKESVELHGGTITFESSPDTGTTFTVSLPFIATMGHNNDKNTRD
ncbi:MAG: PAS domain S-box protein [Anaerolineae bacterium]